MLTLVIGNRNYSSWSLRAWLFMTESGLDFDLIRIPMFTASWQSEVARHTPAGRVPVLLDRDLRLWDTAAIFAHLREAHGASVGWPQDRAAKALARSISAEMHAGFLAVRDELPQNLRARRDPKPLTGPCRAQIERIDRLWSECRARHGRTGPWLFGELCIADIMYAPIALRFVTYGIELSAAAAEFVFAVQRLDSLKRWTEAARAEPESIDFIDALIPAARTELTLG